MNSGWAQSTEDQATFNAFHGETDFACFNIAHSYKMGKKIWLGVGIGYGLSLVHGNFQSPFKNDWTKEQVNFRTYLTNNPQKKLNYEIGIMMGQMNHDDEVGGFVQGERFSSGYLRVYYGWEKFKIGSQFSIGEFDNSKEMIWMWSPIILRYNIFTASNNR